MGKLAAFAALAPIIAGAFTDSPDAPQARQVPSIPTRTVEANELLELASDPQSQLFQLASQTAAANLNRQLASRNLLGGSTQFGAQGNLQAQLANKFLEGELDRRLKAFKAVTGAETGRGQVEGGLAGQEFNQDLSRFGVESAERANLIRGIGGAASGISGAVEADRNRQLIRDILFSQQPQGTQ
jgi:hypothetical protein